MNSGERLISVFPSHTEKVPWRSAGITPVDDFSHLHERAEELAERLQAEPYHHLIQNVAPIISNNQEQERRGGVFVEYVLPGIAPLIHQAIAETLGMGNEDEYIVRYRDDPNLHRKRTLEEINSLPPWQQY